MNVMIGRNTPAQNRRCQVTGRVIGPSVRQKTGFVVQVMDTDKPYSYFVSNLADAQRLRDNIVKGLAENEEME